MSSERLAAFPTTSPSGTRIQIEHVSEEPLTPKTQHEFVVRELRDADPWVIGRAGMHYRDLIPSRLGGSIIASHIRIPEGGPVPDNGALPHCGVSADLLLPRLGQVGV